MKLVHVVPVLPTPNLGRTTAFYRDLLGFQAVEHMSSPEPYVALYLDGSEIVLVQAAKGEVVPNRERYGAGYDLIMAPDSPAAIDDLHARLRDNGVPIVAAPRMHDYGGYRWYEMIVEDPDRRLVCFGQETELREPALNARGLVETRSPLGARLPSALGWICGRLFDCLTDWPGWPGTRRES